MPSILHNKQSSETTLADAAYLRLKTDIILCRLAPGAQFSELELSTHYELGRAALRSALTRLCEIGLIESLPRRGFLVTPISVKSVTDLFDMRLIIEPRVAELATPHVDAERLRALNSRPQDAKKPSDQLAFLSSNHAFHLAIAEATGNQRITKFVSELFDESTRLVNLGLYGTKGLSPSKESLVGQDDQHEQLIAAFESRDADAAREAATRHVQSSKELVLAHVMRGDSVVQL